MNLQRGKIKSSILECINCKVVPGFPYLVVYAMYKYTVGLTHVSAKVLLWLFVESYIISSSYEDSG